MQLRKTKNEKDIIYHVCFFFFLMIDRYCVENIKVLISITLTYPIAG